MYPELLHIGGLTIRTWGVFVIIGFLLAMIWAKKRCRKYNLNPIVIDHLTWIIIITGIIGARIAYVIEHWQTEFASNPFAVLAIWQGGLTFYGGVFLALIVCIIYVKRKGMSLSDTLDAIAPTVMLGLGIGRIGCFFNGCCFGKPTHLPWGMVFPPNSPAGYTFYGIKIHPTQLYSMAACLVIALLLTRIERHDTFRAHTFFYMLLFYGMWRLGVDFIRYYEASAYVWHNLTFNQIISIGLIVFAVIALLSTRYKR